MSRGAGEACGAGAPASPHSGVCLVGLYDPGARRGVEILVGVSWVESEVAKGN